MSYMLCWNKVEDYDTWRAVFDANQAAGDGEAADIQLEKMWRSVDDPNLIYFIFKIGDRAKAEALLNAPEAAESGERSGVLDGDCHFVEELP